jgi:hypothetical protein
MSSAAGGGFFGKSRGYFQKKKYRKILAKERGQEVGYFLRELGTEL